MWYENYFNPKTFEKPASQKYDRTKADPNIAAAINCLCRSFLWVRPFTHGAGAVLTQLPVVTMEPNTIFTPPPGQPTTPTFVNLVYQSYLWLCEKLPVTGCSYIHVHIDLNLFLLTFLWLISFAGWWPCSSAYVGGKEVFLQTYRVHRMLPNKEAFLNY